MNLEDFLVILRNRLAHRVSNISLEFLFTPLFEARLEQGTLVASLDYNDNSISKGEYLLKDQAVSIGALKKEDYNNILVRLKDDPYLRRSIKNIEILLQ